MSTIRLLGQDDLDVYYDLLHKGYQSNANLGVKFDAVTAVKADARKQLDWNPTYGLIADNRLVSAISIRYPWGNNPGPVNLPHLGWFVTHPDYKGKGYGRELYHMLEREILIDQLKLPAVTLGTADTHPWLKQMYEKFNFEIFTRVKLPNKTHMTLYFRKILDPERFAVWAEKNDIKVQ